MDAPRATDVVLGSPPAQTSPPDVGPTSFGRRDRVAEVAYAVLRTHFTEFLAHEDGVRAGEDPEEVHDMRVAIRRMRAALSLFADWLPPSFRPIRDELKWIARALGDVRDLDVQLEQVRTWRDDMPPDEAAALEPLITLLVGQRDQARAELVSALDDERYEGLVTRLSHLIRSGPTGHRRSPRITKVGPRLIRRRYSRVRRWGRTLGPKSDPADLHQLRISGKRLRYAIEFLEPVYPRSSGRMIRRLVALQDILGDHQDAHTALARIRRLVDERPEAFPPRGLFALGRVAERYDRESVRLRKAFPGAFRRIEGKPWKRLRREMDARKG